MGRTKRGLLLAGAIGALAAPTTWAAPGDLDPTFGKDGKTYLSEDFALDLAVQPNGATVTVGDGFVARVTPKGKLDKRFGRKGFVEKPFNDTFGSVLAVALQPDGKIVVAGSVSRATEPFEDDVAVARYLPDGKPDPSFAGDGTAILSTAGPDDAEGAQDVAVQADGKVLVAGQSSGGGLLARFNADGSPDPSFSGDGWLSSPFGFTVAGFRAVAPGPAGSVYAAGGASPAAGNSDMLAVRVDAAGAPDPGFDADGIQTVSFGTDDIATELAVRPDGNLVLGGAGRKRGTILQLTPAGALDPAFNGGNSVILTAPSYVGGMGLDPGGFLYAIGGRVEVIRLTPSGAFDHSFSRGGADVSLGGAFAVSGDTLAVAPDGRVVGAGSALVSKDDSFVGLFRMRVDAGPEDADADGVGDLADDCRYQAGAKKRGGCPLVKRTLTLNDRKGFFHGKVSVRAPGTELFEVAYRRCLFVGKVAIYEVRRGDDKRVARTGAGSSWTAKERIGDGRYYARLDPQVYDHTSLCGGARSKVFRG
jgi:uncharacterized delta-60 repeat protein